MTIIISGALGHMGREVALQAGALGVTVAAGVDPAPGSAGFPLFPSFAGLDVPADAVIDFSNPACLEDLLSWAEKRGVPAVLATTGYTEEQLRRIDEAAKVIPVFRSANMSVGVALLCALARRAAETLGDSFDVEIVEAHHNRKLDAPSGTARMLVEAVRAAYDEPREAVYGRSGRDCKRRHGEIGVHALRGGTVTGEHEVCFFGPGERVRIAHTAENRGVFAAGALRAAAFLQGKTPGLYSMQDVVGGLI